MTMRFDHAPVLETSVWCGCFTCPQICNSARIILRETNISSKKIIASRLRCTILPVDNNDDDVGIWFSSFHHLCLIALKCRVTGPIATDFAFCLLTQLILININQPLIWQDGQGIIGQHSLIGTYHQWSFWDGPKCKMCFLLVVGKCVPANL